MLQVWMLTLWIFIFHNTWRRKSLTGHAALLRSHITAVLEQQQAMFLFCLPAGIWGHAPTPPKLQLQPQPASRTRMLSLKGFLSTPCAETRMYFQNMNVLSLLPSNILFSVIRSKPCWINPFKAFFHHSMSISVLLPSGEKSTSNNAESYLRNKLTKNVKATRNSLVIHRG